MLLWHIKEFCVYNKYVYMCVIHIHNMETLNVHINQFKSRYFLKTGIFSINKKGNVCIFLY